MQPEISHFLCTATGFPFLGQWILERLGVDSYVATAVIQIVMLVVLTVPASFLFYAQLYSPLPTCFATDVGLTWEHKIASLLFAYQVHNVLTETAHYLGKTRLRTQEEAPRLTEEAGSGVRVGEFGGAGEPEGAGESEGAGGVGEFKRGEEGEREREEREKRLRSMKHRYRVNMVHHVAAAVSCLICLHLPELLPDFVFFGGVSDTSTLFLVPLDLCWYVPVSSFNTLSPRIS